MCSSAETDVCVHFLVPPPSRCRAPGCGECGQDSSACIYAKRNLFLVFNGGANSSRAPSMSRLTRRGSFIDSQERKLPRVQSRRRRRDISAITSAYLLLNYWLATSIFDNRIAPRHRTREPGEPKQDETRIASRRCQLTCSVLSFGD